MIVTTGVISEWVHSKRATARRLHFDEPGDIPNHAPERVDLVKGGAERLGES
jgi:hypothetical protein